MRRSIGAFARVHDLIDEPDPVRFVGGNHVTGEQQLGGNAFSDEAWQTLCSAISGDDAELHLRLSELRRGSSEPHGARHREFASAP